MDILGEDITRGVTQPDQDVEDSVPAHEYLINLRFHFYEYISVYISENKDILGEDITRGVTQLDQDVDNNVEMNSSLTSGSTSANTSR
jgi:hypothetical protein